MTKRSRPPPATRDSPPTPAGPGPSTTPGQQPSGAGPQGGHPHHAEFPLKFGLLEKIKRRNVGRVAILYILTAYLVLEIFEVFFHLLEMPAWAGRAMVLLAIIGFPIALLLAWAYEITPDGLKPSDEVDPRKSIARQTGRKLDRGIIAVLAIALAYFIAEKFHGSSHREMPDGQAPEKSVVVLPFVDMSEKHDQEYFADGLTEEMIDRLANAPDLKVIARTSSFAFKGRNEDIREIAHTLGVAHLLEGSVRKAGRVLRITVQLIRASDGTHLWSDTYESPDTNIFKVQDTVAVAVTRMLHATLSVPTRPGQTSELDAKIHDLLLRSDYYRQRNHPGDMGTSLGLLKDAVGLAPGDSSAWSHLAGGYVAAAQSGDLSQQVAGEQANAALQRALSLAPDDAFAHRVAGTIKTVFEHDLHGALHEFLLSHKLGFQPSGGRSDDTEIALMRLLLTGEVEPFIALEHALLDADPLNIYERLRLAQILLKVGRAKEAQLELGKAIELDDHYEELHATLAWADHVAGQDDQAYIEVAKEPVANEREIITVWLNAATGHRAEASSQLAAYVTSNAHTDGYNIAVAYLLLGDRAASLAWLERTLGENQFGLHDLNTDAYWGPIRSEPRFKALLHQLNFDVPVVE